MTDPGVIFKDHLDARVAPKPKSKPPAAPPSEPAVAPPEQFEDPAVALVVEVNEMLVGLIEDVRKHFELKISRLETRLAEAVGAIETLKGRSSRGPRGPAGPRRHPS